MRLKTLGDFVAHEISDSDWAQRSEFERDCRWSVIGPNLLNSDLSSGQDFGTNTVPSANANLDKTSHQLAPIQRHNALVQMLSQALKSHSKEQLWPSTNTCSIKRLGHQFENCWHTVLDQCDHPFYANIPVRELNKKTLGELDLLVQEPDQSEHWWHVEFAVKFYLGYQFEQGENLWIGPNQRDHLIDKLSHMHGKQLPLAGHSAINHTLEQLSINLKPSDIKASLPIMRGCLFQPASSAFGGHPLLPSGISQDAWQGFWTPQNQAHHYLSDGYWAVLPKYRWLSPAVLQTAVSGDAILAYLDTYFEHLTGPLCIVKLYPANHGQWLEQQRWFVVDNDWTNRLIPHTPKS